MKPAAFFRTPEAGRALARAARCAASPVSVHAFERGQEGLRIVSYGTCAACRYVAGLKGGVGACRRSREQASAQAVRLGMPVPFFCHLGFACIAAAPLPGRASGLVMTCGPYCPAEEARPLEPDAAAGLAALGGTVDESFQAALAEVRTIPSATVPGIVEWTVEALCALWDDLLRAELASTEDEETGSMLVRNNSAPTDRAIRKSAGGPAPHFPAADPFQAAPIVAALAGGARDTARALIEAVLAESRSGGRPRAAVRRARAVALAGSIIEAAERAEIDCALCWSRFPALVETARTARSDGELANAVLDVAGVLKRKAADSLPQVLGYTELNEILAKHLVDGTTLNEVAAKLGQNPTAITHRLQRKFNLSFSEYYGRLRVDKAKELLRRTRLSVTEVARRVGIQDTSNFCKLFQKFELMSPLKYRKQFGGK